MKNTQEKYSWLLRLILRSSNTDAVSSSSDNGRPKVFGIWRPGNETIQSSMFLVYLTSHTFWKWFFFWQLNVMYVPLSSHHQDFWKKCTILVKHLYLFDDFTKITCVAAFLHWICIGKKSHILMTEWCVCNVSGQCVVLAELRTQSSRQAADSLFMSVRINN